MTEVELAASYDPTAQSRWISLSTLWSNVAIVAAVLFGILVVIDNGTIAIFDEAVYATQAQSLADGSWVGPRPALDVDPNGAANPLLDSTSVGRGAIAYARHPLYPLLLTPAWAVGGYFGTLLVSATGVLAAATCAAFLARRIDRRYGVPALWLAAVGSPLVVDAPVLWAHSVAAAGAGLLFLGLLRVLDGSRVALHAAYTVAAAVFTVLVRSEGVLFVCAAGLVAALSGLRWRRTLTVEVRRIAIGGSVVVIAVLSYLFDGWWAGRVGSGGYGTDVSALVLGERAGPLDAAWVSLVRPGRGVVGDPTLVLAAACGALVLGAFAIRINARWRSVPIASLTASAVCWLWALGAQPDTGSFMVTGLLAAFPALLASLLLIDSRTFRYRDISITLVTLVLSAAILLATVYEVGGSTEWGGRYFHILLVPLMGPIVLVLDRCWGRLTKLERRAVVLPAVALLVVPPVMGLQFVSSRKSIVAGQNRHLEEVAPAPRSQGKLPLAVVWRSDPDGSSRLFWSQRGRIDVLAISDLASLFRLLDTTRVGERRRLVMVTDQAARNFALILAAKEGATWRVVDGTEWSDGVLVMFEIELVGVPR